jgi:hypothetical protein
MTVNEWIYKSGLMQSLGRVFYNRKVFWLVGVGSRQVSSVRLRLPVAADKLGLYRSLLPQELDMPVAPKIYFYISEFNHTYPVHIEGGYREAAVCLTARCKCDSKIEPGKAGWFPLEMPVSAKSALNSGLIMGYPKYMADISLQEKNGCYEGGVRVEGKEFFSMSYEPSQVEVAGLDEEEVTVPVYLPNRGRVNIMQNEVVEQNSFDCRTGMVTVRVNTDAGWTKLLDNRELRGPGVYKKFTGAFNLTRRSK